MGRRLCFRLMRCERRMLNTDAESVDDMVAASSSDPMRVNSISVNFHCEMPKMNRPVITVVSSTPRVDKAMPGNNTGRISFICVSMPPVKRMMFKAIMPTICAS